MVKRCSLTAIQLYAIIEVKVKAPHFSATLNLLDGIKYFLQKSGSVN